MSIKYRAAVQSVYSVRGVSEAIYDDPLEALRVAQAECEPGECALAIREGGALPDIVRAEKLRGVINQSCMVLPPSVRARVDRAIADRHSVPTIDDLHE